MLSPSGPLWLGGGAIHDSAWRRDHRRAVGWRLAWLARPQCVSSPTRWRRGTGKRASSCTTGSTQVTASCAQATGSKWFVDTFGIDISAESAGSCLDRPSEDDLFRVGQLGSLTSHYRRHISGDRRGSDSPERNDQSVAAHLYGRWNQRRRSGAPERAAQTLGAQTSPYSDHRRRSGALNGLTNLSKLSLANTLVTDAGPGPSYRFDEALGTQRAWDQGHGARSKTAGTSSTWSDCHLLNGRT